MHWINRWIWLGSVLHMLPVLCCSRHVMVDYNQSMTRQKDMGALIGGKTRTDEVRLPGWGAWGPPRGSGWRQLVVRLDVTAGRVIASKVFPLLYTCPAYFATCRHFSCFFLLLSRWCCEIATKIGAFWCKVNAFKAELNPAFLVNRCIHRFTPVTV